MSEVSVDFWDNVGDDATSFLSAWPSARVIDSPLILCAPHSAVISWQDLPQTFSV